MLPRLAVVTSMCLPRVSVPRVAGLKQRWRNSSTLTQVLLHRSFAMRIQKRLSPLDGVMVATASAKLLAEDAKKSNPDSPKLIGAYLQASFWRREVIRSVV